MNELHTAAPRASATAGATGQDEVEAEPLPSTAAAMSPDAPGQLSKGWAVLLASGAYALPLLLSRSTTPSPNHPRVLLWYQLLRKPAFKPPDIAIPVAWIAIESGLAVAAYRLLRRPPTPDRNRSLAWLAGNVAAIGAWSRLFFGSRNLPASTIAAAAMIGTGAQYIAAARRVDKPAAAAGVPLTAWVAFATVLTAALWRMNR